MDLCAYMYNDDHSDMIGTWDFTTCSDRQYLSICQHPASTSHPPFSQSMLYEIVFCWLTPDWQFPQMNKRHLSLRMNSRFIIIHLRWYSRVIWHGKRLFRCARDTTWTWPASLMHMSKQCSQLKSLEEISPSGLDSSVKMWVKIYLKVGGL